MEKYRLLCRSIHNKITMYSNSLSLVEFSRSQISFSNFLDFEPIFHSNVTEALINIPHFR